MNFLSRGLYFPLHCLFFILILTGCGSEGEDTTTYAISTNFTSLETSKGLNSAAEITAELVVDYNGDGILVGLPPETDFSSNSTALRSFITFEKEDISATQATVTLTINHTVLIDEQESILPIGDYNITIRLSTGNFDTGNLVHHDIELSLVVHENQLYFTETFGVASTAAPIDLNLPEAKTWTASTDATWISLSQLSGTGGEIVSLSSALTGLTSAGLYNGEVTFTFEDGVRSVYEIELALEAQRLFSTAPALSFNNQATKKQLAHTVSIQSNVDVVPDWQSTADVNWIALAPDNVNNTLTITIDETVLLDEGLHSGIVTLVPNEDSDNIDEGYIRISYYKDNTDSPEMVITTNGVTTITPDPVNPYVYILVNNQLSAQHIHKDSETHNIDSALFEGVELDNLVVHPTGKLLIASGVNDEEVLLHFLVDLADISASAVTEITPNKNAINYRPVAIIMVDGIDTVVTQGLEIANLALEIQARTQSVNENYFLTNNVYYVNNTSTLFAYDGNGTMHMYSLTANALSGVANTVSEKMTYQNNAFDNYMNFVVNSNEQYLYSAQTSSELSVFTGSVYEDQGVLHSDSTARTYQVAIDNADNSYFYRTATNASSINEVFVTSFDDNIDNAVTTNIPADSFLIDGINQLSAHIFPDYHRVVSYTTNSETNQGQVVISSF